MLNNGLLACRCGRICGACRSMSYVSCSLAGRGVETGQAAATPRSIATARTPAASNCKYQLARLKPVNKLVRVSPAHTAFLHCTASASALSHTKCVPDCYTALPLILGKVGCNMPSHELAEDAHTLLTLCTLCSPGAYISRGTVVALCTTCPASVSCATKDCNQTAPCYSFPPGHRPC